MSYQEKIASMQSLIVEHNSNLSDETDRIPIDNVIKNLKKKGGTTQEALSECTWEDLEDCGIPRILARKVASLFRKKEQSDSRPITNKKAEILTPRELLEVFDPEDTTSPVAKRLQEIAKGQPFIVFSSGRMVDIDSSLRLITELKQGLPPVTKFTVNGNVKKVYKIGELPGVYFNENPLYPGRPLRGDDEICCQTSRSWAGVPLNTRQLVRIILKTVYKNQISHDEVHNLIQLAVSPDAEKTLRTRYQDAAIEFDKLQLEDNLPKLKVNPLNSSVDNNAKVVKVIWPK